MSPPPPLSAWERFDISISVILLYHLEKVIWSDGVRVRNKLLGHSLEVNRGGGRGGLKTPGLLSGG